MTRTASEIWSIFDSAIMRLKKAEYAARRNKSKPESVASLQTSLNDILLDEKDRDFIALFRQKSCKLRNDLATFHGICFKTNKLSQNCDVFITKYNSNHDRTGGGSVPCSFFDDSLYGYWPPAENSHASPAAAIHRTPLVTAVTPEMPLPVVLAATPTVVLSTPNDIVVSRKRKAYENLGQKSKRQKMWELEVALQSAIDLFMTERAYTDETEVNTIMGDFYRSMNTQFTNTKSGAKSAVTPVSRQTTTSHCNSNSSNVNSMGGLSLYSDVMAVLDNSSNFMTISSALRKQYQTFTDDEKRMIVDMYDVIVTECSKQTSFSSMNRTTFISNCKNILLEHLKTIMSVTITKNKLSKWIQKRDSGYERKKRGRQPATAFESAIWAKLLITKYVPVEPPGEVPASVGTPARIVTSRAKSSSNKHGDVKTKIAVVTHSVVYSYAVILTIANELKQQEPHNSNPAVSKLKLSDHWVHGMLERQALTRRRITTETKPMPSDEHINQIMQVGQGMIKQHNIPLNKIWNMDETGFTWTIGPQYMYVPKHQIRATGNSNEKNRISAVIMGNAAGEFAPLFIIIKHSASSNKKPDQTTMRVIPNLHKQQDGFKEADGWELKTWERTLTLLNSDTGNIETHNHKCRYLIKTRSINGESVGHVITSQSKAWNDSVRLAMWLDVVCAPLNLNKDMLIWSDNCGSHCTDAITELFKKLHIHNAHYPKNTTSILQVMDLVVNGPIKQHVRRQRAEDIVKAFALFQQAYLEECQRIGSDHCDMHFDPPKPTMNDAILDLLKLFDGNFASAAFQNTMRKSFLKTGSAPDSKGAFTTFSSAVNKIQGEIKFGISNTLETKLPEVQQVEVNQIMDEFLDNIIALDEIPVPVGSLQDERNQSSDSDDSSDEEDNSV